MYQIAQDIYINLILMFENAKPRQIDTLPLHIYSSNDNPK